jgi:hypothetical protein|tara:strand:+ start:286 stop:480 length:195 start_codon:yes stop_codon:yes gene_type:complete
MIGARGLIGKIADTANIGASVGQAIHTASHPKPCVTSHPAEALIAAVDVEMYLIKHERSGGRPD